MLAVDPDEEEPIQEEEDSENNRSMIDMLEAGMVASFAAAGDLLFPNRTRG
jgi:hypothetical protein